MARLLSPRLGLTGHVEDGLDDLQVHHAVAKHRRGLFTGQRHAGGMLAQRRMRRPVTAPNPQRLAVRITPARHPLQRLVPERPIHQQPQLDHQTIDDIRRGAVAAVTTGLNDWDYPPAYARCLAKNDTPAIARLEQMYLTRAEAGFDYSRTMSASLYGRDIAYILLQHIGSFQAHILPKLIAMYKAKGVRFISLEEAVKDPAYRAYADPSLPAPPRDMEHAAAERKLPIPRAPSDRTDELDAICK